VGTQGAHRDGPLQHQEIRAFGQGKSPLVRRRRFIRVFDKVEPNPLKSTVNEGARLAKDTGCDVVLGVGGGSIMDAAKAIAFAARNEGDLFDFIFGAKTGTDALPLILIPTTCGTGSEGNGFAVITNDENYDKKSCAAISSSQGLHYRPGADADDAEGHFGVRRVRRPLPSDGGLSFKALPAHC
jgi:hypothetical protein